MSTATCCLPTVLATSRPLPMRWAHRLQEAMASAWHRWRAYSDRVAQQRALSALSDSTLRDIGLAERRFDEPRLGIHDWERGRW